MAKKVTALIKLQVNAGKATPAPPIGPALGQHGVNMPGFCKEFNDRTAKDIGLIIPVVITVYQDRSFTFITKTPPAAVLIKKACGLETASGRPNRDKENARFECRFRGSRHEHDRRHCALDGRCRRRLTKANRGRTLCRYHHKEDVIRNETGKKVSGQPEADR